MSYQNSLISRLAIAPMIDWTYSHFRVLMRLLAPSALLYTEMQTPGAVMNNAARALAFHPCESPLALQLGGANPNDLAHAAALAEQQGFAEVNLNLGCPSDKVQSGQFGACLMMRPERVVECIHAIKEQVSLPVTTKIRIGLDELDSFEFFESFAMKLIEAGSDKLIVHARKAWLNGLSPKQNRTIPPLHYDYVYRLKQSLPDVPVVINGGIMTCDAVNEHLAVVDGVMLGRLACQNPYEIARIHHALYPTHPLRTRVDVLSDYLTYIQSVTTSSSFSLSLKPIYNLAHGLSGASVWKKNLGSIQKSKNNEEFISALNLMEAIEGGN